MESIFDYMTRRLYDPQEGFYEQAKISEHFVTPSTLKSRYHNFLAAWLRRHSIEHVIEYGAGQGEMAAALAPLVQSYEVVEHSQYQKQQQSSLEGVQHRALLEEKDCLPKTLVILQECFDAWPAKMFYRQKRNKVLQWHIQKTERKLFLVPECYTGDYLPLLEDFFQEKLPPSFSFVDYQSHQNFLKKLKNFMLSDTLVMIIDYGFYWGSNAANWQEECPLRGYSQGQLISHPWSEEKCMDLTYDMDFSYLAWCWESLGGAVVKHLPLNRFLIEECDAMGPCFQADRMLFDPRLMGDRFKVLVLGSEELGSIEQHSPDVSKE